MSFFFIFILILFFPLLFTRCNNANFALLDTIKICEIFQNTTKNNIQLHQLQSEETIFIFRPQNGLTATLINAKWRRLVSKMNEKLQQTKN